MNAREIGTTPILTQRAASELVGVTWSLLRHRVFHRLIVRTTATTMAVRIAKVTSSCGPTLSMSPQACHFGRPRRWMN
jgi:hypothetical protein